MHPEEVSRQLEEFEGTFFLVKDKAKIFHVDDMEKGMIGHKVMIRDDENGHGYIGELLERTPYDLGGYVVKLGPCDPPPGFGIGRSA